MAEETIEQLVLSERGRRYIRSHCNDLQYPISDSEIGEMVRAIPEKARKTEVLGDFTKGYGGLADYLKESSIAFISKIEPQLKEKLEKQFGRQTYVNVRMVNKAVSAMKYQTLEGDLEIERKKLAFLYAVDAFLRHI